MYKKSKITLNDENTLQKCKLSENKLSGIFIRKDCFLLSRLYFHLVPISIISVIKKTVSSYADKSRFIWNAYLYLVVFESLQTPVLLLRK